MTTMNCVQLLDQIEAEGAANPEWFGILISMGADALGVPDDVARRVCAKGIEAARLAEDASEAPARRALYEQISEPLEDAALMLALAGQQFVNACRATMAAERASVRA